MSKNRPRHIPTRSNFTNSVTVGDLYGIKKDFVEMIVPIHLNEWTDVNASA